MVNMLIQDVSYELCQITTRSRPKRLPGPLVNGRRLGAHDYQFEGIAQQPIDLCAELPHGLKIEDKEGSIPP